MKYVCPFCYKVKPQSAESSVWACCGKVGHAIVLPACPRCGAEFFDPPKPCEVCGYQTMQNTPRTDAVQNEADNAHYRDGAWRPFSPTEDKGWAFARQLERELNAMTICAGVASKERGEWAVERDSLLSQLHELLADLRKCENQLIEATKVE